MTGRYPDCDGIFRGCVVIDVRSVLHYRVLDPAAYALGVGEVDDTLRAVARGVLVDLIAGRPIDALYTTERRPAELAATHAIRGRVDAMRLGVEVVGLRLLDVHAPSEVHDAFRDVASAIEDKDRYNRSTPATDNAIFRKYAEFPELATLINALAQEERGALARRRRR